MADRRMGEDIIAGYGDYLIQKEQQYSRELSEVRSHLEERVREVKTELRDARIDDIQRVEDNLKSDIKVESQTWFIEDHYEKKICMLILLITCSMGFTGQPIQSQIALEQHRYKVEYAHPHPLSRCRTV